MQKWNKASANSNTVSFYTSYRYYFKKYYFYANDVFKVRNCSQSEAGELTLLLLLKINARAIFTSNITQKMKFFSKDFFSKCYSGNCGLILGEAVVSLKVEKQK